MSKPAKSEILVQNILDKIGGSTNIKDVYHCATRMRLTLYNDELAKISELKTITNLKGALWSNGELQLIIGQEVSQITSLLKNKLQQKPEIMSEKTGVKKPNISLWKKFLKSVSAIFGPLIPFLIGVGLVMALQAVLLKAGAIHNVEDLKDKGLGSGLGINYNIFDLILNTIASTGFKLMGAIAMWSTVRYLGGKTPTALALALIMISPLVPESGVHLATLGTWNLTLKPFYSTILVFIAMGIIVAYGQKAMEKYFHPVANFILNPLFTILIGGFIAFFIMGPIMGVLENALNVSFTWIMNWPIGLGQLVVGLTWQPLVVLGVHNILFLAATNALVSSGAEGGTVMSSGGLFLAAAFAAAWAQMGATIAVGLKTKKAVDKSAAFSAALPGIISGPTESCIYAINLPRSLPFFTGVVAGGIGGWAVGIFNLQLENLAGLGGIVGFAAYPNDLVKALLIDLGSLGLGILITYFLWREDKTEKSLALKTTNNFKKAESLRGKVDYQAQNLIKIIWKNNWKKHWKNQAELVQEVENLKDDLIQFDQSLTSDINQFLINLQEKKHDWIFNYTLIKKLKTIKTTRQSELNEIYLGLKKDVYDLKKINSQTRAYAKLSARKANWDWKLNRIETFKEEKNANLFNKGQKLLKSKKPGQIEKGNLLIAKSQVADYKVDKISFLKKKIQETENLVNKSNINLTQETNQLYTNIEKYVTKIESVKNKDLTNFKDCYFNDLHHLEIQAKTINPKIINH